MIKISNPFIAEAFSKFDKSDGIADNKINISKLSKEDKEGLVKLISENEKYFEPNDIKLIKDSLTNKYEGEISSIEFTINIDKNKIEDTKNNIITSDSNIIETQEFEPNEKFCSNKDNNLIPKIEKNNIIKIQELELKIKNSQNKNDILLLQNQILDLKLDSFPLEQKEDLKFLLKLPQKISNTDGNKIANILNKYSDNKNIKDFVLNFTSISPNIDLTDLIKKIIPKSVQEQANKIFNEAMEQITSGINLNALEPLTDEDGKTTPKEALKSLEEMAKKDPKINSLINGKWFDIRGIKKEDIALFLSTGVPQKRGKINPIAETISNFQDKGSWASYNSISHITELHKLLLEKKLTFIRKEITELQKKLSETDDPQEKINLKTKIFNNSLKINELPKLIDTDKKVIDKLPQIGLQSRYNESKNSINYLNNELEKIEKNNKSPDYLEKKEKLKKSLDMLIEEIEGDANLVTKKPENAKYQENAAKVNIEGVKYETYSSNEKLPQESQYLSKAEKYINRAKEFDPNSENKLEFLDLKISFGMAKRKDITSRLEATGVTYTDGIFKPKEKTYDPLSEIKIDQDELKKNNRIAVDNTYISKNNLNLENNKFENIVNYISNFN
ncbi:MAG: hypothetical protein U0457_05575 [Candidatus Sericytochromatia bacterium]